MLHPSYTDLMKVVNSDSEANNTQPIVNSRYSIVLATAKRARQLIDGEEPLVSETQGKKPREQDRSSTEHPHMLQLSATSPYL